VAAFKVNEETMRVLESWTPDQTYDPASQRLELRFLTQARRDAAVGSIWAIDHIRAIEIFELSDTQ
jgi:hypothetical protein